MIDFIYRLNDVLHSWPEGEKWTLQQLSHSTETSVPHVLQYLSEGLGKEIEVSGVISQDEASEVLGLLSKRMRPQIEERERILAERRVKALRLNDVTAAKVQKMQIQRNWHGAFKTLCYFVGQYEEDLPKEYLTSLCNEIVRLGIKSKANFQELSRWLEKGVGTALSFQTKAGIEEALDLVDAYSTHFLAEESGKGPLLLGNILAVLEEPAARFELWDEYKSLVAQLYPL